MNVHVPEHVVKKWEIQYEFVGLPITSASGKKYIRATFKHWPWQNQTHFYSFDDDFFWHSARVSDLP
jgi:hypothetical protein